MKAELALPGVVHLSFPSRKEMTLSMCRAQEHYEAASDLLRGKYFSWETFLDSFADDDGKVDYFSFWSGFNFPGDAYQSFIDLFHHDLSRRERAVKAAVEAAADTRAPFYVIGTLDGATETIRHELLHALYHVNKGYRREAVSLVLDMDHRVRQKIHNGLTGLGYGENVIHDEIQAYLGSGGVDELNRRFGMTESDSLNQCPPFRDLAARHLAAV